MNFILYFISLAFTVLFRAIKLFSPILIPILIIIVIKQIYNTIKYGFKFKPLFRKKLNNKKELIFMMIDKIEGYKKIINLNKLSSQFLLIDKTGLYLIYKYEEKGYIYGNNNESFLLKREPNNVVKQISNPFNDINTDEETLKKLNPDIKIFKIVILNNNSIVKVNNIGNTEVLYLKDFVYKMELKLKNNQKIYNENKINELYNTFIYM